MFFPPGRYLCTVSALSSQTAPRTRHVSPPMWPLVRNNRANFQTNSLISSATSLWLLYGLQGEGKIPSSSAWDAVPFPPASLYSSASDLSSLSIMLSRQPLVLGTHTATWTEWSVLISSLNRKGYLDLQWGEKKARNHFSEHQEKVWF